MARGRGPASHPAQPRRLRRTHCPPTPRRPRTQVIVDLATCLAYLTAKQPHLNYHIALTMGWPIATGVIEGACRYLVKDRLAITGARWSLPSAEAVLLMRTVIVNGDFPAYWHYHLQQEHQRNHNSLYQDQYHLAA